LNNKIISFLLLWCFLSPFNNLYLLNFNYLIDPTLITCIVFCVLDVNKDKILILLFLLISNQFLFGNFLLVDLTLKILIIILGKYLVKNFLWKNLKNEFLLILLLLLIFNISLLSIFIFFGGSQISNYIIILSINTIYSLIILSILLVNIKYIKWPDQHSQTYQF
tara:strand:+ start:53 stop:547 length:495 start_codon:yes stop_codon:yes gene_type:complete